MFLEPLFFALKGIPHVKYEKKAIDNAHFFTFFTTLGLILPKFCPKATPTITIFCPNLCKNGVPMGHPQSRKQFFFCRNNKTRS